MSRVDGPDGTGLPGATAIPKYARVKKTATGIDLCGASDTCIGTANANGYPPDASRDNYQEPISYKFKNAAGQHFAIAAVALAEGAEFEGVASGKVGAVTGTAEGVVMSASSADGDVISVYYY